MSDCRVSDPPRTPCDAPAPRSHLLLAPPLSVVRAPPLVRGSYHRSRARCAAVDASAPWQGAPLQAAAGAQGLDVASATSSRPPGLL
eukprot:CAMPEP_0205857872 /NCGR_PEP_ID=MMETSP1083-20121108/3896_1 /ASSEMBLY_ACC=CAM_ASM_000430 /TAXON_ID=97485 /ORGANISM="Prymnesium parvum, Strain Texoma1" /LENGTH=86 /DNA_ID=CAMNT_0053219395 /DNA_START=509 /DNA_END=765 /DNA_ORIENTATION=-